MGGQVIEGSAIEIDESQLEKGEQWTERRSIPIAFHFQAFNDR